jgi:integron integrase
MHYLVFYGNMDKKPSWYIMGNLSKDRFKLLPEFQKFLLERKLAPEKNIPFLAYWVSRFFAFSQKHDYNATEYIESAVMEFLDALRVDEQILDWQPRQAEDAIKLYYFHYLGKSGGYQYTGSSADDTPGILKETRRLIRLRHYSYSTERTYLQWIERFFAYALQTDKKQTISDISAVDFKNFISHLALKQRVSASTQNQAFNALLFLFRNVLGKETGNLSTSVRAKRGQKLPVVFSVNEIKSLFSHMTGKTLMIAELLYGSGLRLMELARLRVKDIDFDANIISVRSGKGDKDRSTVLPAAVKNRLKEHINEIKALHDKDLKNGHGEVFLPDALSRKYPNAGKSWAWQYIFPSSKLSVDPYSGKIGRHHISGTTIQDAIKNALSKAGIPKHASVHTLRHSFATHLLQSGVNIREVQSLLGHKNVETTMVYTHVLRNMSTAPQSPLDTLYEEQKS